jgi:hypothetical protein
MRKYWGIVICFILAVFFALDTTVLNANRARPTTARIYIEGAQPQQNITVVESNANFVQSSWCQDCVNTQLKFDEETGRVNAKFKVNKADTVNISLMGEHFMVDDKKMPLFTDYANFTVNGEQVFAEFKNADVKNYYKHTMDLKRGATVEFSVDVAKSGLSASFDYVRFGFTRFLLCFGGLVLIYWLAYRTVKKIRNK